MTKASFSEDGLICWIDPDGAHDLPVESMLPHRFKLVDGVIVDKYDGATDNEVRKIDHDEAEKEIKAAQKAWDEDESENKGPRPMDLPALDLPGGEN